MSPKVEQLIGRFRSKGIFVDTNLLLLYVIGLSDVNLIDSFKRTQNYSKIDFSRLFELIQGFHIRVTSPNVLTEVSNLCNSLYGRNKQVAWFHLNQIVKDSNEIFLESEDFTCKIENYQFGLTDSVIMEICKSQFLLLTDDIRLSEYFRSKGGAVLNFNHIRGLDLI